MARVYKSCIKCGYLYDYNGYSICPECGAEQSNIKGKIKIELLKIKRFK